MLFRSITVEAAGYKSYDYGVSATRTYPNLSDADTALIPKTVEENGRTLTLSDIDWQSASTDQMDGYELSLRYTAVATYTGTATGKSATGYVVTADYGGVLSKTTCDTIVYTAVFSGTKTQDITDTVQTASIDLLWLVIPTVAENGRASCRERVLRLVYNTVVAASI